MAGIESIEFKSNQNSFTPIDDLNERALNKYSEEEQKLRKKLAASFRLAHLQGWSEVLYNNITCRVPGSLDYFLINPFGLFFHEVTASSLLKVDINGNVIDTGACNFGLNLRGYTLHSAIHMSRPDVQCVIHAHTPEVIGISSMKDGFIPVSQESCFVGPVVDYGFKGILDDLEERKAIAETLGQNNAMLLRNHGFVICGDSIEQAFLRAYFFMYNVKAQSNIRGNVSSSELILPNQEASNKTYNSLLKGYTMSVGGQHVHWKQGELEWEGWMRLLDSMRMKTGHSYRVPVWRN